MKKLLSLLIVLSVAVTNPLMSQGLLNKVKNAVTKEISGNKGGDSGSNSAKTAPEPKCACDDAKMTLDLGGNLKIDYREISISMKDDGSILVYDKIGGKYYIAKDGVTNGPFAKDDPRIKGFHSAEEENDSEGAGDPWLAEYPGYISRSGNKYLIKVNGKSYGPFAQISDFAMPKSKDKFAAIVIEKVLATEDQMKKMEEAMKNAKSDQERMDISMKNSQQMSQQMIQGGGTAAITPKLVSDVPGAVYDPMKWMGGRLNGIAKYDEIVVVAMDKVIDLKGNPLITLKTPADGSGQFFINSSNTRYANYKYGTITFNDNTTLPDLFNPYLVRKEGKVSISYNYYSPGKNAIMQCLLPF
jgi:hypothetical protein